MKKVIRASVLALGLASLATTALAAGNDGAAMQADHGAMQMQMQGSQSGNTMSMPGHAMSGHTMPGHDAAGTGHAAQSGTPDWEHAKLSDTIKVSGCWIRSLPAPAPSGGYFVVHNDGKEDVKLIGARSSVYGMVMLHQTTQHEGMSKMSAAQDIPIPSGGSLEFKPGGYHAMLEQAAQPPAVGSQVAMSLLFDNGEKVDTQCDVKPANTLVR